MLVCRTTRSCMSINSKIIYLVWWCYYCCRFYSCLILMSLLMTIIANIFVLCLYLTFMHLIFIWVVVFSVVIIVVVVIFQIYMQYVEQMEIIILQNMGKYHIYHTQGVEFDLAKFPPQTRTCRKNTCNYIDRWIVITYRHFSHQQFRRLFIVAWTSDYSLKKPRPLIIHTTKIDRWWGAINYVLVVGSNRYKVGAIFSHLFFCFFLINKTITHSRGKMQGNENRNDAEYHGSRLF